MSGKGQGSRICQARPCVAEAHGMKPLLRNSTSKNERLDESKLLK